MGGTVAYFLQPGDSGYKADQVHGLIMNPNGWFYSAWGSTVIVTGATATAFDTGMANTSAIIAADGKSCAAYMCDTLTSDQYELFWLFGYFIKSIKQNYFKIVKFE